MPYQVELIAGQAPEWVAIGMPWNSEEWAAVVRRKWIGKGYRVRIREVSRPE